MNRKNIGRPRRKTLSLENLTLEDVETIKKQGKFSSRGDVLALLGENRKESRFMYEVYAADLYDRNTTLQSYPEEFENKYELIQYLYHNHDKLENRSFGFLSLALKHGGNISEEQMRHWHGDINAANYAAKKQDLFSREILNAYKEMPEEEKQNVSEKRLRRNIRERMDHDLFTWIEDDEKTISERYLKTALRFAMLLYGDDLIKDV